MSIFTNKTFTLFFFNEETVFGYSFFSLLVFLNFLDIFMDHLISYFYFF